VTRGQIVARPWLKAMLPLQFFNAVLLFYLNGFRVSTMLSKRQNFAEHFIETSLGNQRKILQNTSQQRKW
jgi:hypothetical protein